MLRSSVNQDSRTQRVRVWIALLTGAGALLSAGCAASSSTMTGGPTVIFLDGAGWAGSERGVRAGLRAAGFQGNVESFAWTTGLGSLPDHFLVRHKQRKAARLADHIRQRRARFPNDDLHLMGLSAGTAVIVFALEQLPPDVSVNNVVLFAPSIVGDYDLSNAMAHVRGFLYATSSPHDGILKGLRVNADGGTGQPAGLYGLRVPARVKRFDTYTRVVNLPWRPPYADLGWSGSHTGATGRRFVQNVIAPRVLSNGPRPLNHPLAPAWIAHWRESTPGSAGR